MLPRGSPIVGLYCVVVLVKVNCTIVLVDFAKLCADTLYQMHRKVISM